MTTNEALALAEGAMLYASYGGSFSVHEREGIEALSVLRAVVEDYEKARPLIQAAIDLEFACGHFNIPTLVTLGDAALAYREGRKP